MIFRFEAASTSCVPIGANWVITTSACCAREDRSSSSGTAFGPCCSTSRLISWSLSIESAAFQVTTSTP